MEFTVAAFNAHWGLGRFGRLRDEIQLGRRTDHSATPLIARLAQLGL